MSGARKLTVALGLVATTAALAAAFVTANGWLYVLAALAGVSTLVVSQLRAG